VALGGLRLAVDREIKEKVSWRVEQCGLLKFKRCCTTTDVWISEGTGGFVGFCSIHFMCTFGLHGVKAQNRGYFLGRCMQIWAVSRVPNLC